MMSKYEFKKYVELDEIVSIEANGVYVVSSKNDRGIRIRELVEYCNKNSKESSKLSKEEITQFNK